MSKRQKHVIWGIAAAVAAAMLLFFLGNRYDFSGDAKEGRMEMEKLQKKADQENFDFQIAPDWVFESGGAQGEVFITNPIKNPYKMQVSVMLDEEEREVYRTDILIPGDRIRYAVLMEPLPQGTYDATAYFTILDLETEESVGKVAAGVKIEVQK